MPGKLNDFMDSSFLYGGTMDVLQTPSSSFQNLKEYPFPPYFININGLDIHYVEEGTGSPMLCLHGEPTWSYLYRHFLTGFSGSFRVIAPDLPGFGKSDKPSKRKEYHYKLFFNTLKTFIQEKDLNDITLVVHDWGGLIGLGVLGDMPDRFSGLIIMNTALPSGKKPLPLPFKVWQWYARFFPVFSPSFVLNIGTYHKMDKACKEAYEAPFPGERYKKGCRAMPGLVPSPSQLEGTEYIMKARQVLGHWYKPVLIMFGKKDPVFSKGDQFFDNLIPDHASKEVKPVKEASHFIQEDLGTSVVPLIEPFLSKNK